MAFRTVAEKEEQFKAEMARYAAQTNDDGFVGGFIGGHSSVGSWFTSGLSGLLLNKGASDNAQRKWYVQRNGIQFGKNQLDKGIAQYKEIQKHRKLNSSEQEELDEMLQRNKLLVRDLEHVFDSKKGDLDAPIDKEGKSFNDRWGVDTGEEGAIAALVGLFKENPSYIGGVFTAEILKDLPITVLAYLGLGPGGAGASGATLTRVLNKLNNIQPKVLRGLAKVGTGVAAGGVAGAGYEAAYSALDEGSIKGDSVRAGAAFGSAFGILAGLGVLGRTSKDMRARNAAEASVASAKGGPKYKEMVQEANKPKTQDMDNAVDSLYPAKEIKDAKKAAHKLYTEHNKRIFPELEEDLHYKVINLKQAKELELPNIKDDVAVQMRVKDGVSHIVWQEKKITPTFKRFYDNYEENLGTYFKGITPRQHLFLRDENSFRAYLMAQQLAQVKQRLMPEIKDVEVKQNQANDLAMVELERAWDDVKFESQNKSDLDVEATIEAIKARVVVPEIENIPTSAPTSTSRIGDYLEKNPKTAYGAIAGVGAATYALSDKEEGDPIRNAAVAMLAVGLGPKAYRVLKGETLNQVTFKIKAEIARNLEVSDNLIRAFEERAQNISDKLDALPRGEADFLINDIETGKNSFNKGTPQRELKEQIKALLAEYSKLAREVDLIAKDADLDLKTPFDKGGEKMSAPFIANYFPHLFVNMDKLTDADLAKLFGTINANSAKFRTIDKTLIELQKMVDNGELSNTLTLVKPSQAINLYAQGMGRAIIGRRAINAMLELDLNLNTPKGKPKLTPAMLSLKEFEALKAKGHFNDQEALHYRDFRHPSLEGFVAHNNVHHVLDDFFKVSDRGGMKDMAEKLLKFNNALKRVFVFGSLFHAQALVMSSVYAMGGIGAIKGIMGKKGYGNVTKGFDGKAVQWEQLQLNSDGMAVLVDEWLRNSPLKVGSIKKQELTVPGFGSEEFLTSRMGKAGAQMQKAFDVVDVLTWDFLHDRMKIAVAMKHKEKLMYTRKGKRTLVTEADAYERAAIFANDAFGSLDFNNFTTKLYDYAVKHPDRLRSKAAVRLAQLLPVDKRRWLNLGLFAPDWTISNIRIVGKMFSDLPEVSKALADRVQRGNWKDAKAQEIVRSWNMYAAYSARAGAYTSAMWWVITEIFAQDGIEPTMEGLWEFWSGDNSGKLELGNGESMVISKQIAEPIHWIQHPVHTLMNKTSVVPKTALEAMFNKQWFSLKQGMPLGPRLVDEDGTTHYAKWLLGKVQPIVTKPLMDEDLDAWERIERVLTGFVGLPQYGNPED